MRIAVDGIYFGVAQNRPPDDLVRLAQKVGADGLNWPFHEDYLAQDTRAIRSLTESAGLQIVSLGLTRQLSAVPGAEEEFREAFAHCLEAATALGVPIIDCWPYRPEGIDKERAQSVLRDNLKSLISSARSAGITISIEFQSGTALETFREAYALVQPFRPTVKLTVDTCHVLYVGDDLVEAAALLGPDIGVVHFSGSHRGEPGSEGDLCDYDRFLVSAHRAGYGGDIVLQYHPPKAVEPSLKRAVQRTRRAMAFAGLGESNGS